MVLSKLLGHASEVNSESLKKQLSDVLLSDENIEMAFKVIRDLFIFTNRRFMLVDKQGLTGKKVEYKTFPYKSISHFSVESAGRFDMDAELKIWIRGIHNPIEKELKKGTDIVGIQKTLAYYITK